MGALAISAIALATLYVIAAFTAPIMLRSAPVLPVAIWTLWFDRSRPFQGGPAAVRQSARVALLLLVMAFAIAILGLGLNWLYDPNRVI